MEQFVRVSVSCKATGWIYRCSNSITTSPSAVFFMNTDKTIYGRFGTRAEYENAAKDISIEGFKAGT